MRATRRGAPDSAARLRSLTRRAYTATAGHLDLDDDAGREFDRIVRGDEHGPGDGASREHRAPPARRWAVPGRAVVVVVLVVAALAGAVVARAIAFGPSDAVPVPRLAEETDVAGGAAEGSGSPDEDAGADGARPSGGGPADAAPSPERSSGSATDGATAAAVVVVHVAGAVAAAGVVTLPAGTRVSDAVDAAGGALPEAELAAVNLARPLVDGEQVYVPRVGEVEPGPAAGAGSSPAGADGEAEGGGGSGGGVVDLNTADLAELDTLPGVGPAIAQRILDWRTANGSFHSVDELLEVPGIGPATLERLREQVRV